MASHSSHYTDLRDRLVGGEFAPGQRLKSEELAKGYGISASSLREILFRLSTVGLVSFQEQRGFRVPELSDALQHDLTQFRILLECEGACLSIRNGGVAWESRLSAAHHKLSHIESRAASDADDMLLSLWTEAELEFHQTLIDACRSDLLKQTHEIVYFQFRQQMINSDRKFVFVPENITQHKAILDAALQKDEAEVRAMIRSHLARNLIWPVPDLDDARV